VANDVGGRNMEPVEQQPDVVREVDAAVAALGLARKTVASHIDEN
jgi:hypothetical protein